MSWSTTVLPDVEAFSHSGLAIRDTCSAEGRGSAHPCDCSFSLMAGHLPKRKVLPYQLPAVKNHSICILSWDGSTTISYLSPLQSNFVSCGNCHRRCFCLHFSPSRLSLFIWSKPHSWVSLMSVSLDMGGKKDKKISFVKMSMGNKNNLVSGRNKHLFSLHPSCCCLSSTNACITPFLLRVETTRSLKADTAWFARYHIYPVSSLLVIIWK